MPIQTEFQRFGDEKQFTTCFLVPLLRRLGYSTVTLYHGAREFGKDLVFAEIDRFGQVTFHGLQAKYVPSIGLADSNELVADCKQAFNNPFTHPTTGSLERICVFVVANAGSISDSSRTNFFNAVSTPHGGHVRLIDGTTLLELDRWASVARAEAVGELLSGLRIELNINQQLLAVFQDLLPRHLADRKTARRPLQRLRIAAISHYLQSPLLTTDVDTNTVVDYWFAADAVNRLLDSLGGLLTEDARRSNVEIVIERLAVMESLTRQLEASLTAATDALGPLAGM
jgi:hypothetical protein